MGESRLGLSRNMLYNNITGRDAHNKREAYNAD